MVTENEAGEEQEKKKKKKKERESVFFFFPFFLCVENLTFTLLSDGKQSCTVKAHSAPG